MEYEYPCETDRRLGTGLDRPDLSTRYMVTREPSSSGPWTPRKFYTYDNALARAKEFASKYPGVKFYICEAKAVAHVSAVVVEIV